MNKIHYLDYNSTHPPIMNIIQPCWEEFSYRYFNPSGANRFSLSNQKKIEEARKFFHENDSMPLNKHVFCSTGTEANYTLLAGIRHLYPNETEMYTSPFEHSSFYSAMEFFGFSPIVISTDPSGLINLNELWEKMKKKPLPGGFIYACNETGVIQPMESISSIFKEFNRALVSDCMQAFCKIIIDYSLLDGYTCSGHKIGSGPGASMAVFGERFHPLKLNFFKGGNQENTYRAGTENLPAICAFHKASEYQIQKWGGTVFNNYIYRLELTNFLKNYDIEIIAEDSPRLPNTIFAILPIEDLDFFLIGMEERNILISTGSSCKSRAREPSPSLLAMGYTKEEALRAIRISWGMFTTQEDIEAFQSAYIELSKYFLSPLRTG